MDSGFFLYLAVGCSVLLPLGARIAGNDRVARRLDLLPRFVFGAVALLIAFRPESTFQTGFRRLPETWKPVSGSFGRPVFGLIGLFLIGSGIRVLMTKSYDVDDDDGVNLP